MTRKEKSKIICRNLLKEFDWLQSQESVLVSSVMDSLKEIEEQDSNNKTVNIETVKVFDNRH